VKIVIMGTGTFAEPTFEALLAAGENVVGLVTQPERESTARKSGSTRQTGKGMANIAQAAGVPVIQPESINTPEGVAALRAFAPDLLVVAAYGQILKPEVIATPTMGAINVHASLLPKYRGASPIAHAILNGETISGVTIIRISLGLDAGDMLQQESLEILENETTGELEARLAPLGARMCLDVIQRMRAGRVEGVKQDPSLVTKAPKLKKEDGLIDWTKPADEIANHVRAMQPWPTAYTFLHRPGKPPLRVIIIHCEKWYFDSDHSPPPPGTTSMDDFSVPSQILISVQAFRTFGVLISELQPAGGKRMTAAEFLRGYPLVEGSRFGKETE